MCISLAAFLKAGEGRKEGGRTRVRGHHVGDRAKGGKGEVKMGDDARRIEGRFSGFLGLFHSAGSAFVDFLFFSFFLGGCPFFDALSSSLRVFSSLAWILLRV